MGSSAVEFAKGSVCGEECVLFKDAIEDLEQQTKIVRRVPGTSRGLSGPIARRCIQQL